MTGKNRLLQKYVDKLEKSKVQEEKKDTRTPYMILYKGKQLIMDSGKSVWLGRRNASSALNNHLGGVSWRDVVEWENLFGKKSLGKVLEEEGIVEFKTIEK